MFCYCFGTLVDSRFRKNYNTIWGSNQININQREIWHYKVFFHGSCEENTSQSKLKLTNVDRFVGFSNGQIIKMMISFLQRFTEGHDYASHVLYPELIELLLVDIFTIYRKGSPKYFSNSSFFWVCTLHIAVKLC